LVLQGRGLWQIASSYLFGVGFFTLLMGRLFQIQSWPYAQEMIATMWLIGPIMAIATLIFFALHYKNLQNRNFAVNMLVRIGALGLIGICFGSLVLLVYKLAKPHIFKEN
jgi:cation transport ATPase